MFEFFEVEIICCGLVLYLEGCCVYGVILCWLDLCWLILVEIVVLLLG